MVFGYSRERRIMAVLFAVLAILCGLIGCFLFGYIGLAVTVLFVALAVVFAIKKRKANQGKGGVGPIVCSVIGLLLAGLVSTGVADIGTTIRDYADKAGVPEAKTYADGCEFGIVGFVYNLANKSEEDLKVAADKIKEVLDYAAKNSDK